MYSFQSSVRFPIFLCASLIKIMMGALIPVQSTPLVVVFCLSYLIAFSFHISNYLSLYLSKENTSVKVCGLPCSLANHPVGMVVFIH